MKTIHLLLTLALSFVCHMTQAQNVQPDAAVEKQSSVVNDSTEAMRKRIIREKEVADTMNATSIDVLPAYPGGNAALLSFVAKNLVYPPIAVKQKTQGIVVVKFLISTEGTIIQTEIDRSLTPECDQAAIDVVKKLRRFTPAQRKGKAVPMWYRLPFRFRIQK